MRSIALEIGKLVGYTVVGAGEQGIKKLGSAKIGTKPVAPIQNCGEQTAPAGRVSAPA
jgi:hypothetical protein